MKLLFLFSNKNIIYSLFIVYFIILISSNTIDAKLRGTHWSRIGKRVSPATQLLLLKLEKFKTADVPDVDVDQANFDDQAEESVLNLVLNSKSDDKTAKMALKELYEYLENYLKKELNVDK